MLAIVVMAEVQNCEEKKDWLCVVGIGYFLKILSYQPSPCIISRVH
jgi:hypothetical protein